MLQGHQPLAGRARPCAGAVGIGGGVVRSDSELIVALILGSRAAQRDLIVLLIGGATPAEAAARLGIDRRALAKRLLRLRRHADRVAGNVPSSGALEI